MILAMFLPRYLVWVSWRWPFVVVRRGIRSGGGR